MGGVEAATASVTPDVIVNISFDTATSTLTVTQAGSLQLPNGITATASGDDVTNDQFRTNGVRQFGSRQSGDPGDIYNFPSTRAFNQNFDCARDFGTASVISLFINFDTPSSLPTLYVRNESRELLLPTGYSGSPQSLSGTATRVTTANSLSEIGFNEGQSCFVEYDASGDGMIDTAIQWNVLTAVTSMPTTNPTTNPTGSPTTATSSPTTEMPVDIAIVCPSFSGASKGGGKGRGKGGKMMMKKTKSTKVPTLTPTSSV